MYLKKVTKLFKGRNSNKSKTTKKQNKSTFYDHNVDGDLFVAEHIDILRDIKQNSNTKTTDAEKNRKKRARKPRKNKNP